MKHYQEEQRAQDEEFEKKWTDIMRWSDDYEDRGGKGSSASQVKSYLLSRDQALLEAFKKDTHKLLSLYGLPECKNLHHRKAYQHGIANECPVEAEILTLLKDYNLNK